MLARPGLSRGSAPAPARATTLTCTTGTSCCSTSRTGRPFERVSFCTGGSFSARTGPSAGGFERSGFATDPAAGVCAARGKGEEKGKERYA